MSSLKRALYIALTAFVAAMVGHVVQWIAPTQTIMDGRAAVGSVIGVIALLLALVLGLLIWTSFGVFANQNTESQTLGLSTLKLDYLLEQYGPEAIPGRLGVRETVRRSKERYFSGNTPDTQMSFALAREKLHDIDSFFAALHPVDDERRQLLANAKMIATSIVQTQLVMSRQLVNPVPELLLVMVQIWTALLFLGFGMMSNPSIISILANAAGAFAVSSAIFLITEFSEPYSGLFRISSEGIDKVIEELATVAPKAAG
jgi:hypothetical protein